MSRKACTFRQSDLAKAIKGAKAGGLDIARVEITPDGRIIVIAGSGLSEQNAASSNPWDGAQAA
jgi:hypothetical protein